MKLQRYFSTASALRRKTRQLKELADRTALAHALHCTNEPGAISAAAEAVSIDLLQRIASPTPPSHTLCVRPCPSPFDRGDGVYCDSIMIPCGTALCFYGGLFYSGTEVEWLGGSPTVFQQSDPHFSAGTSPTNLSYLLGCSDGGVINGDVKSINRLGVDVHIEGAEENITMCHRDVATPAIGWDPRQTSTCLRALKEREKHIAKTLDFVQWGEDVHKDAYYSMGSKINHPSIGENVSVVGWPVSINLDSLCAQFSPCVHAIRSGTLGKNKAICSTQTVVFIAIKDIYNSEELLLDYNLEASPAEAPSWFSPTEELNSQR
jgi:hypothetical protein